MVKIRRKKIQACKGLNFLVVFRNAKIVSIFTSLTAIHIYDFHIFMVIYSPLHGFIYDQHDDQLLVGWLAQLVEHFTGIAKVMGSNPVRA